MAPITLIYFNFPGRAEAIRLALVLGGIEFEDKRLTFEEFRSSGFKHLPVMQMDGTTYTQSTALLRYAGKLTGLIPEDPLEALQVDEVIMTLEDISNAITATNAIKDKEKKLEARKAVADGEIKYVLETLEAKKAANPSTFFFGDSITIADLMIHAMLMGIESGKLDGIPPTIVSDFAPSLHNIHLAVKEHPKVKEWYASKK